MGRPKLLLPWGDTTVLGHLVAQWRMLGANQIAVVCPADDRGIPAELDRFGFSTADRIFNPAPERGMFSSIQCAARWIGWNKPLTHWAVVLGDQPHLRAETLRRAVEFSAARFEQPCQPSFRGRPRHPVFLPKTAFLELAESTAADLKEFLASREMALCELDDPGLDLDIDRPEDYRKALRLWEEQGMADRGAAGGR
jgi:molybdenum cofactor cytidylyltransferase